MSRHDARPCACARAGLPINCKSCRFHRALRAEEQRRGAFQLRVAPTPAAAGALLAKVASG